MTHALSNTMIADDGYKDVLMAPKTDALTPGLSATLVKPVKLEELIKVVEGLLAVRRP